MKTWVVSDASGDEATECSFFHFWTPRGLTRQHGRANAIVATAKRCGWRDTIAVVAPTHREAMLKAKAVFDRNRARLARRKP